jgi:hypothetical protein
MAVEQVTYGIQRNRNRGSIGVYFCFSRDECLRLFAELDRLRESGSELDSDSDGDSDSEFDGESDSEFDGESGGEFDSDSGSESDDRGFLRDFAGNFVLGHQFQ